MTDITDTVMAVFDRSSEIGGKCVRPRVVRLIGGVIWSLWPLQKWLTTLLKAGEISFYNFDEGEVRPF